MRNIEHAKYDGPQPIVSWGIKTAGGIYNNRSVRSPLPEAAMQVAFPWQGVPHSQGSRSRSQCRPPRPRGQAHSKEPQRLKQVLPLRQGLSRHSSTSRSHRGPSKPAQEGGNDRHLSPCCPKHVSEQYVCCVLICSPSIFTRQRTKSAVLSPAATLGVARRRRWTQQMPFLP